MLERIILNLDKLNHNVARVVTWFILVIILVAGAAIILEITFAIENKLLVTITMINGLMIMFGAAFFSNTTSTLKKQTFTNQKTRLRYDAIVNLITAILFLLPMTFLIFGASVNDTFESLIPLINQISDGSGAIKDLERALLIFLKFSLWGFSFLLALAAISLGLKSWLALNGKQSYFVKQHKDESERNDI